MTTLRTILRESYDIDPASVTEGSSLSDLGIDSLIAVNLMLDIETSMGFSFTDISMSPDPTIQEICRVISENADKLS